ncbi:hypothetical protein [Streptomyces sp. NRRL S-15]|uniref:hypothetical protein n=1 Tax=Streptomyces sp. NRRL S-15 TaxID=1463886 RepID=UPI001F20DBE0|nr:hypothetical protein [Streptomyces sp. NRRL S-15]
MWLYVRDEAGNYVHQQEIKRTTGDSSGRYLDNGAWCYGWWPSNAYPADQCFWWSGSTLGGHLEDGKKYYAWIFQRVESWGPGRRRGSAITSTSPISTARWYSSTSSQARPTQPRIDTATTTS